MLSRRLIQKLEALNDDTLAYFEQQADLLRTMPEHCRARASPRLSALRLVRGRWPVNPALPAKVAKTVKATLAPPPTLIEYVAGVRRFVL